MADAGWQRELEVTDADAASGTYSVLAKDRVATGNGPMQNLTGKVNAGRKYKVAAKVKYTSGPDSRDFAFTSVTEMERLKMPKLQR